MNPPRAPTWAWISTASLGATLLGLSSCSLVGSPVPAGQPVRAVYEELEPGPPASLRIDPDPKPGVAEKTRPVIYPPKVFAVFVPEHLDPPRDMKVGAHWVYFKLRDSSWTEEAIDREPEAKECATPPEVALLKEMMDGTRFGRMIVPYRPAPGSERPLTPPEASEKRPRGERP
jgi:hypothetical protein